MSDARASFVERADDASGWGLSNLPLGAFGAEGRGRRIGVRIGDSVLDLHACVERGIMDRLDLSIRDSLAQPDLNAHMGLGPAAWSAVRAELARLLDASTPDLRDRTDLAALLLPEWSVSMRVPCRIGDYTDFYASLHHATNVGSMFRPDNPLLPNWKHVPIGYHGRASSIVATGTPVHRPLGQTVAQDSGPPSFGPSKLMDYELEMGAIIGVGNDLGVPIPVAKAASHVYGFVIVNDWSARDVQKWEYQPLGPFLAKNFATTVSGWVVSMEALVPYRVPLPAREAGDPQPLPYLVADGDFLLDVQLEVSIASAGMRAAGAAPTVVSRGRFTDMYWSIAQMVAHHASGGCNLQPGDMLASGTISGASPESRGCLLERTWRGTQPITLGDGSERRFLQDGDEVVMRAWCEAAGKPRIAFGDCRGVVLPARA
jgi:fumarylacetoacetase